MARERRVDKVDSGTRVPCAYEHALRQACIRECEDLSNPFEWLGADEQRRAEIEAAGVKLAKQRLGEPVTALWYQLPPGLPAPLNRLGKVGGPRAARVTSNDVVTTVAG